MNGTIALLAAIASGANFIGEAPPPKQSTLSLDFSLAAVSDYRFRGVSLSDGEPALQPELTLQHRSGAYANLWGSNTSPNDGADLEIDLTAGYAASLGALEVDVAGILYVYPGASSMNYAEAKLGAALPIGKASIGAELLYAPAQDALAGRDNLYLALSGSTLR